MQHLYLRFTGEVPASQLVFPGLSLSFIVGKLMSKPGKHQSGGYRSATLWFQLFESFEDLKVKEDTIKLRQTSFS